MGEIRVEVIAEIANAHQGKPEIGMQLAKAGFEAGADAVKFQVYFADELLVRVHPRYEHFKKQSFAPDVWQQLLPEARKMGRVYCDVFGARALDVAAEYGAQGLKIHGSDLNNTPLLQRTAERTDRLYLAVGGSTMREIAHAVQVVRSVKPALRPILLHGFQAYPTAIEDSALLRIQLLRQTFGEVCDIGYMDHVSGDDPFAFSLPLVAVAMGAVVLEKHITLDRSAKGVDYYSSLNPGEFADFVQAVRKNSQAIGESPDTFSPSERTYRRQTKKYWVARRALPSGHVLELDDVISKRIPESPTEMVELDKILGRALLHDCAEEHVLTRADVSQTVWALVVARMRSSRLPSKAVLDVAGMPALQHLFARLKQARTVDRIVFCTTTEPDDDTLVELATQSDIPHYRGPTDDVLARMLGAIDASGESVDVVLRVTGDDILVDPDYVDRAVRAHLSVNAEYSDLKQLPSGTEVEVFDTQLLRDIKALASDSSGTEYLTMYVTRNRDQFRTTSVCVDEKHRQSWRLTLDAPEDYELIRTVLEEMRAKGKALTYRLDDLVELFGAKPNLLKINAAVRQRQKPPEVSTELEWKRLL